MLPRFLQLPLTIDFSASKHNCFDNTLLISCCIPPVVINHPRVVLLLIVQPANTTTTALTTPSTFRVAIPIATRFTFPTAIDYSNYKLFYRPFSNQQTQRDTCLGIYNSFYSSFCICHAICPPPIIQPANTTATGIDNCFHCYDTTTDYMLFTQLTQHLAQFKFNFPFYNCNFYWVPEQFDFRKIHHPTDQLSPAGLTSVKYTTLSAPSTLSSSIDLQ